MNKNTVIETLNSFEEEFNAEELFERLLFVEKVEKGLQDSREGKVMTLEQVKQKFSDKWSK
jgi:hypothetical protein